jgi:hypothetical protein
MAALRATFWIWIALAAPPQKFVTNNDTTWKVYHPSMLTKPEFAACLPFFKELVTAGADVSFLPWPADKKFGETIRSAFPGESKDFYRRFHRVAGLPPGETDDIWSKDYLIFCEFGESCTLLRTTDKGTSPAMKESDKGEWDRFQDARMKARTSVNEGLAAKYEIPIARWPLRFEGGNIANAGKFVLMAKSNFDQPQLRQNPNPSPEDIAQRDGRIQRAFESRTKEITGREILWLEPLPYEGTGHIDMFTTVVGETVLVGQIPQKLLDEEKNEHRKRLIRWTAEILDHNAYILESKGLKVTRIPMPAPLAKKFPELDEKMELAPGKEKDLEMVAFPTYSNSIQLNVPGGKKQIFLPDPDTQTSPEQEGVWKKKVGETVTKLGFEAKWIPRKCSEAIEAGFGSISCVTGACPTPVRKKILEEERREKPDHD